MNIIDMSVQILDPVDEVAILTKLELCGRTAYKSENRITPGSAAKFIGAIIRSGHDSVLEHVSISVRFVCDRGITHELVRHRIASYTQESTRYVNYNKKGMTFIKPPFWKEDSEQYKTWLAVVANCEKSYNALIESGAQPQQARSVLPESLKTEIVATMNIREWRHVLSIRTQPDVHPQMRMMMQMLLAEFKQKLPVLFGDINTQE
ncbi:MAG TPA: FAD-dependent thymidylate synthase [Dehalococcoidales bacterium]|nr:FAD-dependent thymidylate synthase [Dehalococcoidales bacterium]